MASGQVNRIKRPNTWPHRPMLQNVKKALANPEPSTHGTFRTSRDVRFSVAIGSTDMARTAISVANDAKRAFGLIINPVCRRLARSCRCHVRL
jgi:hypothetical protein